MKKKIPLILSFFTLVVISFFWDHIKLPYDENNVIVGNYYYKKQGPQKALNIARETPLVNYIEHLKGNLKNLKIKI